MRVVARTAWWSSTVESERAIRKIKFAMVYHCAGQAVAAAASHSTARVERMVWWIR